MSLPATSKARGLDASFRFFPYQDRAQLRYSLGVADVHCISLKPPLEGLIVPSKFYGIAAAGRPIIAITAADGEIARLVGEYDCGIVIEPGQADALAALLTELSTDARAVAEMGARARAMLDGVSPVSRPLSAGPSCLPGSTHSNSGAAETRPRRYVRPAEQKRAQVSSPCGGSRDGSWSSLAY